MRNVALIGTMGSGKTTIATELSVNHGFRRIALADAVKDDAVDLLNAWLDWQADERFEDFPNVTRETIEAHKSLFRPFLQWLGTEWGRQFVGPDTIWVEKFLLKATGRRYPVVCDDVRFLNEAAALKEAGFVLVRVHRPEVLRKAALGATGIPGHSSETELEAIQPDYHVYNDYPEAPTQLAKSIAALCSIESEAA